MIMKLNNNFYIQLNEYTETRWRTIKNNYGHRELEEYEDKKFYPKVILTKNGSVVCKADEMNNFLELLGAFVANQLNPQKEYKLSYTDNSGFIGKIIRKKDFTYLALKIAKENYLLEKYDCRVIIANAKQILSKCTLYEFI